MRLSEKATGSACGEIGEILFELDEEDTGFFWDPYGLAMTPDGRLFTSDSSELELTVELTTELEVVRSFEQPVVDQVGIDAITRGVTYNPDTGTLWWLNIERDVVDQMIVFIRALLVEGDLDGVATGRRIDLPLTGGDPPVDIFPLGASYDSATHRYYFSSFSNEDGSTIWAVDTLGAIVPGYPVRETAYPGATVTAPDAHGGASGEPEAVRLELTVAVVGGSQTDRLVVSDPTGVNLDVETLLPDVSGGSGFGSITGEPLRSRVDPNGVLYFPFVNFDTEGVVGIRPHPLPPSWLALSEWDGTLGSGESVEIDLTFSAGTRNVGNTYEAALQVFEAETGEALEVPLSLEVAPPVDTERDLRAQAGASLSVYPNPAAGPATLAVSLPERVHLRVAVYDVLGRQVVLLADKQAEAGPHRFSFDGASLPAGVYLVRATAGAEHLTERIAIVR